MTTAAELKRAFEPVSVVLRLDEIMPARSLGANVAKSRKYARIASSVAEIGLVEPLVVSRRCPQPGKFLLLDGHARLAVLVSRGEERAKCIVANDDEAFTYNKRVSHLATIQEQQMIMKALARGTPEARIAAALNVDVKTIRARRSMLEGVCPEVIDRLKARSVNPGVFAALKRMKPLRQIEATALMLDAGNLNVTYARVLLAGTRPGELVSPEKRKVGALSVDQMDRMQLEFETVQSDFKAVEASHGDTVFQLVVASGYIEALIANDEIASYMSRHFPEILDQFRTIARAVSLDEAADVAASFCNAAK